MSIIIRLDAFLIPDRPRIVQSDPVEPQVARVNCVLHCEHVPAHHCLEVHVNNMLQQGVAEGEQLVFAWQFTTASDEARITLLRRGAVSKDWQGCWNERDALLHCGTLPVRVFFDGKPQPSVQAVEHLPSRDNLVALPPIAERVNGKGPIVALSSGTQESSISIESVGEQRQTNGMIVVQDLLVLAEAPSASSVQQTASGRPEDGADEDLLETTSDESDGIEEDYPDEMTGWEPNETREDKSDEGGEDDEFGEVRAYESDEEVEEEPDWGMEDVENEPDEAYETAEPEADMAGEDVASEVLLVPSTLRALDEVTTSSPHLAAFHASPLAPEKTLEALKGLMEALPPKTILVDLRRHSRTKKRDQGQNLLSKDLLRATFGGKYWDRGWAIQTTYWQDDEKGHALQWRRVLVDPDDIPDGIPSLVQQLEAGYSLVIMDSLASYAESPRRAVIEELQKRLTHLVVGPLG